MTEKCERSVAEKAGEEGKGTLAGGKDSGSPHSMIRRDGAGLGAYGPRGFKFSSKNMIAMGLTYGLAVAATEAVLVMGTPAAMSLGKRMTEIAIKIGGYSSAEIMPFVPHGYLNAIGTVTAGALTYEILAAATLTATLISNFMTKGCSNGI
ncbi:MAG: hypothetical protein WCA78_03315 [Rhizomicrobium sp.]